MRPWLVFLLPIPALSGPAHPRHMPAGQQQGMPGEDGDFWTKKGEEELAAALAITPNTGVAKNIILFIGDGMSLPTVTAARIFKGQKERVDGAWASLSWESFPHVGLSKTYCANYMVPDSAATASAMYTGQKTTFFTMGYNSSVVEGSPDSTADAAALETVLDWAQQAGKKTGFVTTTRMSHATPAALYAKTPYRFWEGDQDIQKAINESTLTQEDFDKNNIMDISRQLIESEAGSKLDVMFGGGRASFLPESLKPHPIYNKTEPRFDYDDERDIWDNYRLDGKNLIEQWKAGAPRRKYVATRGQMMDLNHSTTDQVMGIFTNSYMVYDDMVDSTNDKPRLVDMATEAVKFLKAKAGPEGFFIMIEGGRIDAALHNGQAVRALSETLAFDLAIEEVLKLVDLEETLVIVTADHSHTLSMGGYTPRDIDITGAVDIGDSDGPLSILSFGNGLGFRNLATKGEGNYTMIDRNNVKQAINETADIRFRQPSSSPLSSETHGGDDVGIWAAGPWSHLVHGVHQQSYLATVMRYAGCLGRYSEREGCPRNPKNGGNLMLPPVLLMCFVQALNLAF